MRICVDTTILLDILKDEFRSFQDRLYAALAGRENLVAPYHSHQRQRYIHEILSRVGRI